MSYVALITGGQRGIGLGIAEVLKIAGFKLVITSEKSENESEVISALEILGDAATYLRHDLRDIKAIPDLLNCIEQTAGPITTLVSNAGIPAPVRGDLLDLRPENFDLVLDVNLRGGFFLAQAIAQRMVARESTTYRSMLFVTSVSAEMASIERAEYCISKSAASMMSRLFAARLAETGIGVFEIRPGIIETDMTAGARDRYDGPILQGLVPAKRWGLAADIGQAALPLATGQMAYSTGAVIPVDGGLSIQRL